MVLDTPVLNGKPNIRGTRISVAHFIGLLAGGWTFATILEQYPTLTESDVTACLAYVRHLLELERAHASTT